ncbi:hypothetical protein [Salipiger abyssi]|uniref:hypothetical protein n=1 Tax=Salipiger abyssi TaxID=1250539 RepID=UPI0009776372|nr:hypothetical protein [Salipiger abyssi]
MSKNKSTEEHLIQLHKTTMELRKTNTALLIAVAALASELEVVSKGARSRVARTLGEFADKHGGETGKELDEVASMIIEGP